MSMTPPLLSPVRFLSLQDSKSQVAKLFSETGFQSLAVLEEGLFLGILSKETIEETPFELLSSVAYKISPDRVSDQIHWLNYGIYFKRFNCTELAVVNTDQQFLGYVTQDHFLQALTHMPMVNEEGVVLELQRASSQFSLAVLVQIFEQSNLSVFGISIEEDSEMTYVTAKLGSGAIGSCLASLRRYEFEVVFVEGEDDYEKVLATHAAYLNTYLNI